MNIPRAGVLARAWTATTLLMLSGCSQQSSSPEGRDPVSTRSMYMHLFAEAPAHSPSQANVIAVLTRDRDSLADRGAFNETSGYSENDFVLEGGDAMQGCLAASCQPLEADVLVAYTNASIGGYKAFFPFVADTDYTVMLNRPAAASASATRVQIPPYFELTTPYLRQVFGPGEQLLIASQPMGIENTVRVNAGIACSSTRDGLGFGSAGTGRLIRTFPQHQGSVSIPIDELVSLARASRPGTQTEIAECRIFLDVAHERYGTVDPAFRGGEAIGRYWVKTEVAYRQ